MFEIFLINPGRKNAVLDMKWYADYASAGNSMQSTAVVFDNEIYLLGGRVGVSSNALNTAYKFSPTGVRTTLAPLSAYSVAAVTVVYNNEIYLIGGYSNTLSDTHLNNNVYKYNPNTGVLSSVATMPMMSYCGGAVVIGDILYYGGGLTQVNEGVTIDNYHSYDFKTGVWTKLPPHPDFHAVSTLVGHDGKLYSFGGERSNAAIKSNKVHCFDPATNEWELVITTGETVPGVGGHDCVVIHDGMLVTGGRTAGFGGITSDAWYLDLSTKKWTRVASIPTGIAFHKTVVLNDQVYMFDGYNGGIAFNAFYRLR